MGIHLEHNAAQAADQGPALLERIQSLQPLFKANAESACEGRTAPLENILALHDAGIFSGV